VWGVGVLVYRGELLATLDRTLRLVLGRWWPCRLNDIDPPPLQLRLGAPIALATIGVACVQAIAERLP
jgi:hypothetical protein